MSLLEKNLLLELKNATSARDQSKYFEDFYNQTSHLVFNYCRKKSISSTDADDITQIIYTQIYKKKHLYNEQHSPLAWLYVVTRSETKDYLKNQASYKEYVHDFKLFLELSQTQTELPSNGKGYHADEFSSYFGKLTETEKEVIQKRYLEEMSFEAISKDLSLTTINLRKIVSRALKKLKKTGAV
ncbi:MAG: RNA polymerase sigma factor [Pseudobdellovibrio sp.]